MAKERKQIILNEIKFWKQNKLLPDHYCDFLTTLYTEGEEHPAITAKARNSIIGKEKRKVQFWAIVIPVISILLMVATFLVNAIIIIAVPAIVFAITCFITAFLLLKKNQLLAPIFHLSAAFVIFGVSLKICLTYFDGSNVALYSTLIGNCILWMISGVGLRLPYFTIAGGLGIITILIYGGLQ